MTTGFRYAVANCPPSRSGNSAPTDRKSTRLNSSHMSISYAVFCLKKKTEVVSALIALLHRDIFLSSDESVMKSLRQLSQSSFEVVPMVVNALQITAPRVRVAVAQTLERFDLFSPDVLEELRSFFFNDTATTEIYTLSLHDALPI